MSSEMPEKQSKVLVPTKHLKNLNIKKSKQNKSAKKPEKKFRKEITIEDPISESESNSDEEILEIEEEGPDGNKKSSQKIITRNPEKHTKIEICPEYLTVSKENSRKTSERPILTTLYKTKIDVTDFDLDENENEPHRYHRMISRLRKKTPNGVNLTDDQLIKRYEVVGSEDVPSKNVRCVCGKDGLRTVYFINDKKLKPGTDEYARNQICVGTVCILHWIECKDKISQVRTGFVMKEFVKWNHHGVSGFCHREQRMRKMVNGKMRLRWRVWTIRVTSKTLYDNFKRAQDLYGLNMTKLEEDGKIDIEVFVKNEDIEKIEESFPNLQEQLHYSRCNFIISIDKGDTGEFNFHLANIKTQTIQMSLRHPALCNKIGIDAENPKYKMVRKHHDDIFNIIPRKRSKKAISNCELPSCRRQLLNRQRFDTIGCKLWNGSRFKLKSRHLVHSGKRKKKSEIIDNPFWICSSHKNDFD